MGIPENLFKTHGNTPYIINIILISLFRDNSRTRSESRQEKSRERRRNSASRSPERGEKIAERGERSEERGGKSKERGGRSGERKGKSEDQVSVRSKERGRKSEERGGRSKERGKKSEERGGGRSETPKRNRHGSKLKKEYSEYSFIFFYNLMKQANLMFHFLALSIISHLSTHSTPLILYQFRIRKSYSLWK